MQEFEINCIIQDNYGVTTHIGIREEDAQPIPIIIRLIIAKRNSFYTYKNGNKLTVDVKISEDDDEPLVICSDSVDINDLDFLPKCHLPS